MKKINVLDESTANKIAAGEVVERPASVVKELVENSIDADSKNITIEIIEGGVSLIKIIDDGNGIDKDDMEVAFLPHATSKISKVEDIYCIDTLGFRGEALASIASISKVSVKSKTIDSDYGVELCLEAGNKISMLDVGMNKGTTMQIEDLFFNVPARKKFLKSISRESSIINDIVTRIALSNPKVSIKLFNNNKKIINTYGTGNLKDVIRTLYGKEVFESSVYFEGTKGDIIVYGYIGRESIAKGSRNHQSIFVNNRYIKNKTITAAVENAFKSFSAINKFPFFVLFIDVPTDFVDVNIHPTKAEIKFNDERVIFKSIFDTVHSALMNDNLNKFNTINITDNAIEENEHVENIEFELNKSEHATKINSSTDTIIGSVKETIYEKNDNTITNFYNNIDIDTVKREEEYYNNLKKIDFNKNVELNNTKVFEDNKLTYSNSNSNDDNSFDKNNNIDNIKKELISKFPELKIIGQFNKMYILAEYNTDLYIIDQHAAHEKILFEKYYSAIENRSLVIQQVLIPTIIDLSLEDFSYYEENKNVFLDAGFVIEEFGGETISIKEVPYFLGKLDAKKLFSEILENLKLLGTGKTVEVKLNKIASMACRTAIKANDFLTIEEMKKLVDDLRIIEDPFHCPHGRPIILKFTEYELNKKFRRII